MTYLGAGLVLACALCMRAAKWIRRIEASKVGISGFICIYKKDVTRESYRL